MRRALIRHPRPLIAPGRCYGSLDLEAEPGAERLVEALFVQLDDAPWDALWTSPARRCRALADPLAAALSVPLVVDARLRERDFGAWEGLAWDAIERDAIDAWARDPMGFRPGGGESGHELLRRAAAAHAAMADQGALVVVSHGGPLRILGALSRGQPVDLLTPSPPFGSLAIIRRAAQAHADA